MMSGVTKIRILIVLGVSGLLFGVWGWSLVGPSDAGDGMTMVLNEKPFRVIITALFFGLIGALVGALIGKPYGRQLGMLAIPAGLSVWSIQSGSMERLLMSYPEAGARAGMFYKMMGEALIWFGLVGLGFLTAWLATGKLSPVGQKQEKGESLQPKDIGSSKDRKRNWLKSYFSKNEKMRGVCGVVLGSIIAIILVRIFGQGRQVNISGQPGMEASIVPAVGQIVFAVGMGFFLAGLAAHQLTETSYRYLLLTPMLVSIIAYMYGARNGIIDSLNGVGAAFVPSGAAFATILPVQYIGVGTLAVIGGYFYSVGLHAQRDSRH